MITDETEWSVDFYPGVLDDISAMPPSISARLLRLIDLMKVSGGNLGPPHTEALGNGLFELRAKAKDGIGRGLFCYCEGKHVVVLCAFVKKQQKTPKREIDLARKRMKELRDGQTG
jgi:phage-related protein